MYLPLEVTKTMALPEVTSVPKTLKAPKQPIYQFLKRFSEGDMTGELFLRLARNTYKTAPCDELDLEIRQFIEKHGRDIWKLLAGTEPTKTDLSNSMAFYNMFAPYLFATKWAKNKQVYEFDPQLEEMLTNTDSTNITSEYLKSLPYRTFYMDMSTIPIPSRFYNPLQGVFVHVYQTDADVCIAFLRVAIADDGQIAYSGGIIQNNTTGENDGTFCYQKPDDKDPNDPEWNDFCMFLINAVLYLCASNAEVEESEITKKTYRPPKTIKNKFSEIRAWHVGVRYGETIRMTRKKADRDVTNLIIHPGAGTSKRPHMRRGHWHHYRTGKGRTNLILKWIPPILVGTGEITVVKHQVKP